MDDILVEENLNKSVANTFSSQLDATGDSIGGSHQIYATVWDEWDNSTVSDTISVINKRELLFKNVIEGRYVNLKSVYSRSNIEYLEFHYENPIEILGKKECFFKMNEFAEYYM